MAGEEYHPQYVMPQFAVPAGNYIFSIETESEEYLPLRLPMNMKAGEGIVVDSYTSKTAWLEPFTFSLAAKNPFANSGYSNLTHDQDSKTITLNVTTDTLYDWWGSFVLPKDRMVKTLTAYSSNTSHQLSKFYNYTETLVGDYNIITVRIPPEMDGLNLTYTVFGDINGDFEVNWKDLLILARAYGSEEGEPEYVKEADFNDDKKIDWRDLLTLARNYGKKA